MDSVMNFDSESFDKKSSNRIVRPSGILRTYTGIGRNRLRPSDSESGSEIFRTICRTIGIFQGL